MAKLLLKYRTFDNWNIWISGLGYKTKRPGRFGLIWIYWIFFLVSYNWIPSHSKYCLQILVWVNTSMTLSIKRFSVTSIWFEYVEAIVTWNANKAKAIKLFLNGNHTILGFPFYSCRKSSFTALFFNIHCTFCVFLVFSLKVSHGGHCLSFIPKIN